MKHSHRVYDAVKRLADFLVAAVLLILLSPVLAVVALLVANELGFPVIFQQPRPGKGGRVFTLYKFRTMHDAVSHWGEATETSEPDSSDSPSAVGRVDTDAERLTRLGRILRSTSLDELPELVNVLLGQMSIVGPRPLLVEYLPLYNAKQARRHEVRPGITGWAQVNGRNAVSWDQRFEMDVWYVDHRSLLLDLKILVMTVTTVFRREGVSAAGHATMKPFAGDSANSSDQEVS